MLGSNSSGQPFEMAVELCALGRPGRTGTNSLPVSELPGLTLTSVSERSSRELELTRKRPSRIPGAGPKEHEIKAYWGNHYNGGET